MVELEHKAQRLEPRPGALVIVGLLDGAALKQIGARRGPLQQPDQVEQRALARTGGADQAGELAGTHRDIDTVQDLGRDGGAFVIGLADAGKLDDGRVHMRIACAGSRWAARCAGITAATRPSTTAASKV